MRVLFACIFLLSAPSRAECTVEPFLLETGQATLPMPGFRSGLLDFHDDAICRSLGIFSAPRVSQARFLAHTIQPKVPTDVLPLGAGLLAPGTHTRCESNFEVFAIDFLRAWSLDSGHREAESVPASVALSMNLRAWQIREAVNIDAHCLQNYRAALESALFEGPMSADPKAAIDAFLTAVVSHEHCDADGFKTPLEGILSRLRWHQPGILQWAQLGPCVMWGWQTDVSPDVNALTLQCPGQADIYLYFRQANSTLGAFVGANQDPDFIENATLHPMSADCLIER